MARSLAAPAPTRLSRGSASAQPASRRAAPRGRGGSGRLRGAARVWRAPGAAWGWLRAAIAFAWRRRLLRIALLAAAASLPLLGGGWLWLRQSPFVSVRRVRIDGVHGPGARAVETALRRAALGMSTLDVDTRALRAAVAPLRVVRDVRAIPSFPHALRIQVLEQLPVASLDVAGVRTAVAADGVALGAALLSGALPSVSGVSVPAPGRRVSGAGLLADLVVLGAAPAQLRMHVERVFTGARGLTVAMRDGLLVYFGDDTLPHAKWLSLARVLADASSAGASYVDVRLPSHPAAGFPAGVAPPDAGATAGEGTAEPDASQESTIAALAAGLAAGSGIATSGASTGEAEEAGAASAAASSPEAASSTEAGAAEEPSTASAAGAEAPAGTSGEAAATGGSLEG
jgi:cell division protein FtsQ